MKNFSTKLFSLCLTLFLFSYASAQEEWPKTINADDGTQIKIYEPQPESFAGNILKARAAISVLENGKSDPTFGTFWSISTVETNRDNRRVLLQSIKIPNIKFPGEIDENKINMLKTTLETEIPKMNIDISLDDLLTQLDTDQEQAKLSKGLNNNPPKIIYTSKPSILVLIDGAPKFQHNSDWGVDAVINTPFTIVKNNDGNYYLYGSKHWYTAPAATGPFSYSPSVPRNLSKVEDAVNSSNDGGYNNDAAAEQDNTIADIIVSTEPAELIQSKGEANMSPIEGTSLLYVANSGNDIFMDVNSQQYYVLISGRWYATKTLKGQWQYIPANNLPADFAKIPEGSAKDNVLASVAGTSAAKEAILDAQIPQTAKVDRKSATTNVTYDGDPQFENITGTDLQYAVNTPGSVIRYKGRYYSVDKGVWFESSSPTGPWVVSVERPDAVDVIPPDYPVYNMKYVYVYDVTPDYVYMGYTPGYLNTFIYGPTVVYGTGFYYRPWFHRYYYPRPYTWGFNMNYNPWTGWGIGFDFSFGWFNVGIGSSPWGYWGGGWWGPSVYRPPYCWGGGYRGGYRNYGYYGNNFNENRRVIARNINRTNNIYNYRRDVVTRDNVRSNQPYRGNVTRPYAAGNNNNRFNNTNRPQTNNNNRPFNNSAQPNQARTTNRLGTQPVTVTTDRTGNVFQRNSQNNQWQQRENRAWRPVENNRSDVIRNLDRQQQMLNRGQQRTQNFERVRSSPAAGNQRPAGNNGNNRPTGRSNDRSGRRGG